MPEYLAPGVYIEEIEIGGKPIEGVSTSTAGFIGECERGPTVPRLITSLEGFRRLYGDYMPSSYLPHAVDGFFSNGGKRCFICRVVGKGSDPASLEVEGNSEAASATDDKQKKEKKSEPSTPPAGIGGSLPKEEKDDKPDKNNPGSVFTVKATGPGDWGNRLAVKIEDGSLSVRNEKYFKLTVIYWKIEPPKPIADPTDPAKQKDPNRMQPSAVEVYDNLFTEPSSSDFYVKRINGVSSLIDIDEETVQSGRRPANTKVLKPLENGKDGSSVRVDDYKGVPSANPGERSGLSAFKEVDEISILCAPNENDFNGPLTDALIEHCELMKDRFAILQASQSAGLIGGLLPPADSKYAAFYYPWIKVLDPVENRPKLIPPGGHIAGIYARSDTERGVHKAPANEPLRGVVDLQFPISKGDQDLLNPRGVNCIRAFPGRGIRVWGARTVSSDPIWKYVNVRRLFLYLEESIEEGTQWVVFEPNDTRLWARVKQSVTDFLTRVWKDGALMGRTVEEAFFVKCDETTMTADDIDNGRLIVLIGVAPVKPAEFVIFRIAQWRAGSEISE